TYVSDKFCGISHYSRAELYRPHHRVTNSSHHPREPIPELWTTIRARPVGNAVLHNRADDGSSYWVDTTIAPYLDAQGKPTQYIAIRADITERKKAEEALRESEQRFRIVADAAPVLIWMSGPDKKFSYVNKAWLDFVGRT